MTQGAKGIVKDYQTTRLPADAGLPPLALRASQAAQVLGIGKRKLWSLTNAGEIPHLRIGRVVLYPVTQLENWLSRRVEGEVG